MREKVKLLILQHNRCTSMVRAAEKIGGPRANTKSGAPKYELCEEDLETCPQEILRFYML